MQPNDVTSGLHAKNMAASSLFYVTLWLRLCISYSCSYMILIQLHTFLHVTCAAYLHTHTYIRTHPHIHTYIHTYIHTHTHTYIHTYIHTCTYVQTYRHTGLNEHRHRPIGLYSLCTIMYKIKIKPICVLRNRSLWCCCFGNVKSKRCLRLRYQKHNKLILYAH